MTQNAGSRPVILGASLTGMAISRTLSLAKVPHVLVGSAPGDLPRLGESLNLEGTLGIHELFPDLLPYCSKKRFATANFGDLFFCCQFDMGQGLASRLFFGLLGHRAPRELLHIERIGFDAALYRATAASPFCSILEARLTEMSYDAGDDRIGELQFSDGTALHASYVFDATNHARVVARRAGVPAKLLGEPQRVVYTHYHLPDGQAPAVGPDWLATTHGARLCMENDGIDALCWCIPLGRYVSVGISLPAAGGTLSDEALLEIADEAFARRQIHYRQSFQRRAAIGSAVFRNFIHERAYGANWLLAGPSYCQVWWMAGAGIGSSITAAEIAPHVLRSPERIGRAYQEYLSTLLVTQDSFDWMASMGRGELSLGLIQAKTDQFVRSNLIRLIEKTRLQGGRFVAAAGRLLGALCGDSCFVRNYCQVRDLSWEWKSSTHRATPYAPLAVAPTPLRRTTHARL